MPHLLEDLRANAEGSRVFLRPDGQPVSVAERWARSGMPIAHEGRRVQASPEELNRWLGRESTGAPVQIATESTDLSSDLKRGLSYIRKQHPTKAA